MNLQSTIEIYAGGPGSGCNPAKGKCGRTVVMYHGTSLKSADSIKRVGLKRHSAGMATHRATISLTTDRTKAKQYGFVNGDEKGDYAVLRLELPKSFVQKNSIKDSAENSSRLFLKPIPPEYVKHMSVHNVNDLSKSEFQKFWKH